MAKAKTISKIGDKLNQVGETFTVNRYDNGFMLEISGYDSNDDWKTANIMVTTVEDLIALVKEATDMELRP